MQGYIPSALIESARQRDNGRCVLCGLPSALACLVFDERLWDDGAYPACNVATVCEAHRAECNAGRVPVDRLRQAVNAPDLLPPHLYAVQQYDRWGNPMLRDGRLARGELFHEPDVQCALAVEPHAARVTEWVKYPRTHVLPWSESWGEGDRTLRDLRALRAERVVATEKLDGQNITLYRDYFHSRSVGASMHPQRTWLQEYWDARRARLPQGWRVCGEYLYLRHAIAYTSLPSYFIAFAVWNDRNVCLDWDETQRFLEDVGIERAPVIYDGPFNEAEIGRAWARCSSAQSEGYVLRTAGEISYRDFRRKVGKFIRRDFIQCEPTAGSGPEHRGDTALNALLES